MQKNGGILDTVDGLLFESLREFVHRVVNFIPNVLVMFFVVLIGVVLSTIARFLLLWLLGLLKFDDLAERAEIPKALAKGGITSPPSRILTSIVYWSLLLLSFMMGFVALDIVPVNNLISDFFSYLPSIIAAVVILIIGFMFGNFVERAVIIAAGISQAELIGKGAKLFIIVLTASMALDQLGIARGIIIAAFSISFGGIVFAISLAFGLGGQKLAREFLEKRLKKKDKEIATEH
jgi:hypothetical protein